MDMGPPITRTSHRSSQGVFSHRCLRKASAANTVITGLEGSTGIADGATVPILYEGRTADGMVKDAPGLDQLFEDLFCDYTLDELAVIKAKYATEGDVLE